LQAEDGIRDWSVTGVQTCALPIWAPRRMGSNGSRRFGNTKARQEAVMVSRRTMLLAPLTPLAIAAVRATTQMTLSVHQNTSAGRSEERRVGKESRSRRWAWA